MGTTEEQVKHPKDMTNEERLKEITRIENETICKVFNVTDKDAVSKSALQRAFVMTYKQGQALQHQLGGLLLGQLHVAVLALAERGDLARAALVGQHHVVQGRGQQLGHRAALAVRPSGRGRP